MKYYEPEYEEEVVHDTVLVLIDGEWVEITGGDDDDSEKEQHQ